MNDIPDFSSKTALVTGASRGIGRAAALGLARAGAQVLALARTVGLDPDALGETVQRWNGFCEAGKDAEFGRTMMLAPIAKGPFYAVELSPSMLNTQGGPRRNEKAQIVRPDGTPIPRLYSAGELGSIYSHLYQGTGNIGECLAFGRISARNAAAEPPWDGSQAGATSAA